MRLKIKPSIFITIFLLTIILPIINVHAVTHAVDITNPTPYESFSYFTTNEVFEGYSITEYLTPNSPYYYSYSWFIDSELIDSGTGSKTSSVGGAIILLNEFDTTVDISTYSVGSHDTKLSVVIYYPLPQDVVASGSHTHDWSRSPPPAPPTPSVVFTTPTNPGVSYDYSASTTYTCAWTISDEDNDITEMTLYMDNVEQYAFGSQPEGEYSYPVTLNQNKTYILKVSGEDSKSNTYSTSTSVIAFNASQYVDMSLPLEQYHNSEIVFQAESSSSAGLHNMSVIYGDYGYWVSNETSNNADVPMDVTWDWEYGLLNWSQFINSATIVYGNRLESSGDYNFYKDIVLTNPTATTLTNFVAYVSVTFNSNMQTDFDDIAFYSTGGVVLLDFDKAEYTASTTGHFWVEIPSFTGSGTYTTRMFYGKTGASVEDEQGTWDDNNVVLAMHLNDNDDSSGSNYDFTDTGDGVSYSASQIGDGCELQGTDDYLKLAQGSGAVNLHSLGTSFTILSWMWMENDAYYCQYSMQADILSLIYVPEVTTSDTFRIEADSQYISEAIGTSLTEDTYGHITTRVSGTDIRWYVAGQEVDNDVWTADLDEADNDIFIGIEQALNNELDGFIDELFVISEVWSDHEIEAFYEFQGDQGSWVSTGSEVNTMSVNNSITVSASYDTGVSTKGTDYFINFTATSTCQVESINITIEIYDTLFYVYNSSANTIQTNTFTMDSGAWNGLSECWFNVSIFCYDDNSNYFTTNLLYFKDTVLPIVILRSPENRTVLNPYSNLQIITLDYNISDSSVVGDWPDNMKTLLIDGEVMHWSEYPKHKPIIFYEGFHTLNITAKDRAGNEGEATATFYYSKFMDVHINFFDPDGIGLLPETAKLYINGERKSNVFSWNCYYDSFGVEVRDYFNQSIYSVVDLEVREFIDIELPLTTRFFFNNNSVPITCYLWNKDRSDITRMFEMEAYSFYQTRLYDWNYTIRLFAEGARPIDEFGNIYERVNEMDLNIGEDVKTITLRLNLDSNVPQDEDPSDFKWVDIVKPWKWWSMIKLRLGDVTDPATFITLFVGILISAVLGGMTFFLSRVIARRIGKSVEQMGGEDPTKMRLSKKSIQQISDASAIKTAKVTEYMKEQGGSKARIKKIQDDRKNRYSKPVKKKRKY
ncbi:MAG: hypothetical protein GPJ52_02825 [Candidatus Heimdallarchaeota archaeon]|nr:hypothetical protein [Candidatus Heimdallarchaeota archaeon]